MSDTELGNRPGAPASEPWPDHHCRRAWTSPVVLADPFPSTALEIHGPLLAPQPFPGVTWALGLQPKRYTQMFRLMEPWSSVVSEIVSCGSSGMAPRGQLGFPACVLETLLDWMPPLFSFAASSITAFTFHACFSSLKLGTNEEVVGYILSILCLLPEASSGQRPWISIWLTRHGFSREPCEGAVWLMDAENRCSELPPFSFNLQCFL